MASLDIIASLLGIFVAIAGMTIALYSWRPTGNKNNLHSTTEDARTQTFTLAIDKIGSKSAGDRIAGIKSLAELADSWPYGRQACIDILCAYLRVPTKIGVDISDGSTGQNEALGRGRLEESSVRGSVLRTIAEHLHENASSRWHGCVFDLTGAVLDGGTFSGVAFTGGTKLIFRNAVFGGGTIDFSGSIFKDSVVDFSGATFSGGTVNFSRTEFSGGLIIFRNSSLAGGFIDFSDALFRDGEIDFSGSSFSGGAISFSNSSLSGAKIDFRRAEFAGGMVDFRGVNNFNSPPKFDDFSSGRPNKLFLP